MTRPIAAVMPLTRGAAVGVAAPGFAVDPAALRAGMGELRARGFRVREGRHLLDRHGYFAGDDEARAEDLEALLLDPELGGVWFARGGYGTARLLDRLPWRRLRRRSLTLVGYSDLTALFAAASRRAPRLRCLHGPVVAELGDERAFDRRSLAAALAGRVQDKRLTRAQVLAPGRARGRLAGGNLTVLVHTLGTPWEPDLHGAVLCLEEVGEEAYRVDRLLAHLRAAGALSSVAAVLLGQLTVPPTKRRFPPDRPIDDVLREALLPLGVPVVRGLSFGHVAGKWTLPLGGQAELDTEARRLRLGP